MSRGFDAIKSVTIDASRARVWETLTNPELVKQWMHGTNLSADWKVGRAITWKGEYRGNAYVDKGVVLAVEPEKLLSHTHWSPLGGSEDRPENHHTVTYELVEEGGQTVLTLTQDNNATQEAADKMAEDSWGPVLLGLKEVAEK